MHRTARDPWSVRYPLVFSAILLLGCILFSASTTNKSSKCRIQDTTNSVTTLDSLPKFIDIKKSPLCHRLPDASATYIWSHFHLSAKKLRPSVMKSQIQNSPSHAHMQRLANQIVTSDEPVGILILLSKLQAENRWPQRLQNLFNKALGTSRVKIHTTSIDDENQMLEKGKESAIVIDCRGADEIQFLKNKFSDLTVLPDATSFLHVLKQRKIRSLLTKPANPPLLILVGESPRNSNPLSSSVYSRTVQRLANWYQLGYIMKEQDESDSIEQTIAFAILVWVQDFCSSTPLDDSKALLPGVQKLVEQVMPPSLELSTTWQSISAEWHRMERG